MLKKGPRLGRGEECCAHGVARKGQAAGRRRLGAAGRMPPHLSCARPAEEPEPGPKASLVLVQDSFRKSNLFFTVISHLLVQDLCLQGSYNLLLCPPETWRTRINSKNIRTLVPILETVPQAHTWKGLLSTFSTAFCIAREGIK